VASSSFTPGWAVAMATATAAAASSLRRDDTRKPHVTFLIRTLLLVCKIARCVAAALIRVLYLVAVAAPAKSLLAVAKVAFSLVNAPCLRYVDRAALGRSCTGTFCGDLLVGPMAHSWRMLVQGLTSLMFLCAHAGEYVRPPPSPLVLMAHDKPASHPQQVRACFEFAFDFLICSVRCSRVCKNFGILQSLQFHLALAVGLAGDSARQIVQSSLMLKKSFLFLTRKL
jgi:hypothetical protein